jgi:F-type H+-transporting ATPase subunit gamma
VTRLSEIESHIGSMSELLDVVGAIRSLAGIRMQEAQRALPGIRRYAGTMAAAVATALRLQTDGGRAAQPVARRRAIIVCAAEHGFVGGFNERIVAAALATLQRDDVLFVVGGRGAALLRARGRADDAAWPMATRIANTPETVDRVVTELYARIARGEIGRVEVIYAQLRHGEAPAVVRQPLLPLDPAAFAGGRDGVAPLHNLAPGVLLEALVSEYVFALLTEAAVESLASENAARLAAMEAARDNVSTKLEQLRQAARQARQAEITAEVLELIAGADAQRGGW